MSEPVVIPNRYREYLEGVHGSVEDVCRMWEAAEAKVLTELESRIEALKATKAAQAHIESQYNVFSKLDAATGALQQKLDAALAMLRRVQWEWFDMNGIPGCPVCYAKQRTGIHAPGCELAKLLEEKRLTSQ